MFKKFINFSSHNWWAIIYFNFKMLPFKQAIKLPFDFYYKIRFENLEGKIKILSPNIKRAMIKIGGRGSEMFGRTETILDLKGYVEFGEQIELGHGSLLRVEKAAEVRFGNRVRIGALTKVFSENRIDFGNEIDFSWECQIFDTNFHDIVDLSTSSLKDKTGAIKIGSYNWFGNRVSVMKGTFTPDNIIVAANSLCNKNYLSIEEFSVLGGMPVKIIGKNSKRIFE